MRKITALWFVLSGTLVLAAERPDRWIVMLQEPSVARALSSRDDLKSARAAEPRRKIQAVQSAVRKTVEDRGAHVVGATQTLLNAVFISATQEQADAVKALPGVAYVIKESPVRRHLSRALDLVSAPAAWSALGGQQNAGRGMKIGIIDTGIDSSHAAFNDPSLAVPSGFPKCASQDCPYTNNKIIVARSYVTSLASVDAAQEFSRPDDLSPRDRVGHGTAMAMIAAGNTVTGPAATITGIAPKAFLGNYKVFGSPGINDLTFPDVVAQAVNDAFDDGMDVVALSLGLPALWSFRDRGSVCNLTGTQACDPWTEITENAAAKGLAIVVSAGNDGDLGTYPNLNSINTPGSSPATITVGATTNAHTFFSTLRVAAGDAPPTLNPAYIVLSDGPPLSSPVTATVIDAGRACSAPDAGSLNGSIALILRTSDCSVSTQVANAQKAGAIAALLYREQGNLPFRVLGLTSSGIPSAILGNAAGLALKSYLGSRAGARVTINPGLVEYTASDFVGADEIAFFSSQGPAIGDLLIKPELVAPGTGIYTATQKFDPNGDVYDASGFTAQQGTSYAAALVAGAVAMAKQHLPRATAAQLKSAVVNTADPANIIDFDINNNPIPARVTAMGAGKLNAGNAAKTTVVAEPAVISFGAVKAALPSTTLKLTNLGTSNAPLSLSISQRDADSRAQVSLSTTSLTLAAGASSNVTVRLTGSTPSTGSYEGAIIIKGGAVDLRVPYLYLVGSTTPDDAFQVSGFEWSSLPGATVELDFKVVDASGVPIENVAHRWLQPNSVSEASKATDSLGFGYALMRAQDTPGEQSFSVEITNFRTLTFPGTVVPTPEIRSGGVVNAASGQAGQGVAPGSYISIFGTALGPTTRVENTPYLPLSLANVSVSFDAPAQRLSLPGRIHFVSNGQVNVQVPWELQGLSSVKMKVSISKAGVKGSIQSAIVDVPLNDYSPAFFEYTDAGNGRLSVAALDENFRLVSATNGVQRNRVLQLYVNGLGPVDNQPPTGELSPSQTLARTRVQPTITIGGQPAQVSFSGLAPNLVGLYQVNVVVPQNTPVGPQTITLTINGVTAKSSTVVVQ